MEKLMTIEDVATNVLGMKKAQVWAMARKGILPVVKVGRQYRVDPEALREWIRNGGQDYKGGLRKTDQK